MTGVRSDDDAARGAAERLAEAIGGVDAAVGRRDSDDGLDGALVDALAALARCEAEAAPHLHRFHGLRHAARVYLLGGAVLCGGDCAAAARAVAAPLRHAQVEGEFAPWIATLEGLASGKRPRGRERGADRRARRRIG